MMPMIADRAQLQVRIGVALGDAGDDLARARRVALAEHEQRAVFHFRRVGAGQHLLDAPAAPARDRCCMMPAQRHQLQLLVVLRRGRDRLARRLAHFDFERLGVLQPAAVGELLAEIGQRGQRLGALAELRQAVGLPVDRRVGAVALQADQPIEVDRRRDRTCPARSDRAPVRRDRRRGRRRLRLRRCQCRIRRPGPCSAGSR